jgi:hypothetical protein
MVDISIIIVNYNTKDLTLQCVKSIVYSKSKLKYEIILIDNGSTDGSLTDFRKFKISNSVSRIKIIGNNDNLGFSKANNQGIKSAVGKYILLLNSDTKTKRGALEELVSFANSTPDAGVVGSQLLNIDGSFQPSVFRFPTILRAALQYWFGKKGVLDKYVPTGDKPVEVDAVVGASFLITPKGLQEVGFLDERFFMFYEDLNYCRRVWKEGLKVYYLPKSQVIHYHGASGTKVKDDANQWRRLIPSSKIYHGIMKHYFLSFIIWSGQKLTSIRRNYQE